MCLFATIHFSPFTSTISSVVSSFKSTNERAVKEAKTNKSRTKAEWLSANSCDISVFSSSSVRNSRSFVFGLTWN